MEGFIGSPRSGGDFRFSGRLSGDHLVDWWGVCGAPALLVVPQLRPAECEGGQIHATCDISGEEPMPHHHVIGGSLLDTGCPNEEEPQETPLSVV